MTMTKLITTTVLGLALALTATACDKGSDKAAKADDKKAAKADAKAGDAKQADPGAAAEAEAPDLDPKVAQAVEIANKISADPAAADSILAEAGMDREAFERLLYEIAKDPELSKSYAVARDA